MSYRRGFSLIGLIAVIAIIAFLIGGGFFVNKLGERKSTIETGVDAIKRAEQLKSEIEKNELDGNGYK